MKKIKIIALSLVLLPLSGMIKAQDAVVVETSAAKAEVTKAKAPASDYLPQAGNFAIGADATPVFNYLGRMFDNTGTNTLNLTSPAIYGKYYLTDKTAIRAVVCVDKSTRLNRYYVADDVAVLIDPLSKAQVLDTKQTFNDDLFTSLAYQIYIGDQRLRGFYGAQIIGGFLSTTVNYTYGNALTELNPVASIGGGMPAYTGTNERLLENKTFNSFTVGLGGIAGFEYYILPRVCIGGEVSLNFLYTNGGQTFQKLEKMEGTQLIAVDKALTPGDDDFTIETQSFNPGFGNHLGLYVMFHF